MSRPKSEWIKSFKEKKDLRKESKKDLKQMSSKFDEALQTMGKRKRDQKREEKEELRLG